MVEQRTIIDHALFYVMYHEGYLDKREEYISKPIKYDDLYVAKIPNLRCFEPIIVKKDVEIKTVYFSRGRRKG